MTETTRCGALHQQLIAQLAELFEVEASGDSCLLVTPHYFPDNSEIVLRLTSNPDGSIDVSDGGAGSDFLFLNGISNTAARTRGQRAARRFGLGFAQGEIYASAQTDALAERVIEVITAVQHMALYRESRRTPARTSQPERFRLNVERFLAFQGRAYERDVSIQGSQTGSVRKVDFRIQPSEGDQGPRQLVLFTVTADSSTALQRQVDHVAMAALDIRDRYRVAAVIDDHDPGLKTNNITRASFGDFVDDVVGFSDALSFSALLRAA